MDRYPECLCYTLREESGLPQQPGQPLRRGPHSYMDHPSDPQGATMMGVVHRVYDAWREGRGLPRQDVRKVSDDEVYTIYWEQYWLPARCPELPRGIDLAVFDWAVHSGPTRAVRKLQAVLGVEVDGHLGAVTIDAAQAADHGDLLTRYMTARRTFARAIPHYGHFKRGWEKRFERIEAAARAMIEQQPAPASDWQTAVEPTPRAVVAAPSSMARSDIGNNAAGAGAGGVAALGVGTARALKETADAGREPTTLDVLLAIGTQPEFWIGLGVVFCTVVIWLDRRRKMLLEAV